MLTKFDNLPNSIFPQIGKAHAPTFWGQKDKFQLMFLGINFKLNYNRIFKHIFFKR